MHYFLFFNWVEAYKTYSPRAINGGKDSQVAYDYAKNHRIVDFVLFNLLMILGLNPGC
jgi:hypothetical protein